MDINYIFSHVDNLFSQKKADEAEQFLRKCLSDAENEGDLSAVITLCSELGGLYRALGRYDEGSLLYEKSLSAIDSMGLNNTEHHATTLVNYGTNFAVSGNPSKAIEIFGKAADIFENLGFAVDYRVATLHNNMSILCQDTGEFEAALSHLDKALTILKQLSDSEIEIAVTHTNMAQIYLQWGKVGEAEAAVLQALQLFDEAGGDQDVHYSGALETLGQIQLQKDDVPSALSSLERAKALTARDYGVGSAAYQAISELLESVKEAE